MSCDWDAAKAIQTFFKEPEDCEIYTFKALALLEHAVVHHPPERKVIGYRNPVKKVIGCYCPEDKMIWQVKIENLVEGELGLATNFRAHAELIAEIRKPVPENE
jgi:hypothetical protein